MDCELFNVNMLPFDNVLPDRWQQIKDSMLALFDEHWVIKIGENKVNPHLHLPVHKRGTGNYSFQGSFACSHRHSSFAL